MLAHSQYHVLPPMTVFARRFETILGWASQDVVNGPTKSRVLARCVNSLALLNIVLNKRLLSKHDINVKRYWDNIVPIKVVFAGALATQGTLTVTWATPRFTIFKI